MSANQAKALAELMARFIDRGEYSLAIEAGQAAVVECLILAGGTQPPAGARPPSN